ncbi:hypothetical protein [Levyella massiliensis]|nr:hypothetical protein [Levyella massiliensis]
MMHFKGKGYTIVQEHYYPEGSRVRCIINYSYGGPVRLINVLL